MRCNITIKTFFFISTFAMLIFLYLSLKEVKSTNFSLFNNKIQNVEETVEKLIEKLEESKVIENFTTNGIHKMKYILQWTSPRNVPFVYMGKGQRGFIERNCSYTNCFVTSDRNYLGDYTKFDVIAFAGPEIVHASKYTLPNKRSPHQKFAFASIESPDYYPVCSDKLDNFFNWTWTFKLDSDARWGYVVVRDSNNTIIGPNTEMHWLKLEQMDPVSNEFKEKLKTKTKAAAWFVSNCHSRSGRENYAHELNDQLRKYKLSVDIYGRCGSLKCPPEKHGECVKMIQTDYYFYLSFENSLAEDYVTEKLLTSLENNAVPIVFGAANYTRFMPDGIYLNARQLSAEKMAEKMNELILNPDLYAEYFRWKNHYSYHRRSKTVETDDYCRFCSMLNEEDLVKRISTYPNFRKWWDPPNRC